MNILDKMVRILSRQHNKRSLISKGVFISGKAVIDKSDFFEGNNKINGQSHLYSCYIGKGTYIQDGALFIKTKIGKFCSIGNNVRLISGNHPTREYVSTYPALYRKGEFCGLNYGADADFDEYSYVDEDQKWLCEIGNDVWIGDSVLILNGCRIGNGAIIAAGAVVTRDVEPYSIVGGVPAKLLRKRFNEKSIDFLQEIKWWDRSDAWIMKHIHLFHSIDIMRRELDDSTSDCEVN